MINLGDRVKCKISGAEGIVVARHDYLHSSTRYSVQPKSFDGKPVESAGFDGPQLEVIEQRAVDPA
jgi:hypothetical protein